MLTGANVWLTGHYFQYPLGTGDPEPFLYLPVAGYQPAAQPLRLAIDTIIRLPDR